MKVVLLLFLATLAFADIAPLLHAFGPNVVPGSYIVVLKDGLSLTARDAHILSLKETIKATNADATVMNVYSIGAFVGFSAVLNEDLLKIELQHPEVKFIEANQVVSINNMQHKRAPDAAITQIGSTWGITRISQREDYQPGDSYVYNVVAGEGVDAYVIDTGILTTHVDFGGRAFAKFTAFPDEENTDLYGHGTHVAGIIGGTVFGVAKEVRLLAVKVMNGRGFGTTDTIVSGIDYIANSFNKSRPSIASMSILSLISEAIEGALTAAIKEGVTFTVAAGNNNINACYYSPSRMPGAITVGASTNTDARASFSNYGECVDIFAPGLDITAPFIGSNTATNTMSGTSMATPHVAGVLAVRFSLHGVLAPPAAKEWLLSEATKNVIVDPGPETPNLLAFSPLE